MEQTEEKTTPIQEEPQVAVPAEPENPATQNDAPAPAMPAAPVHENVLAGIVGAFLFALGGGILYFLVYQLGYIAGICGLVTVVLSGFGYQLFSGKKNSLKGVVVSIIMLVAVIFLAEYLCLSFEIFKTFKAEYEISFFDAVRSTPAFLQESEILAGVIKDLVISYLLGAVASFANIRAALKTAKAEKEAALPGGELL